MSTISASLADQGRFARHIRPCDNPHALTWLKEHIIRYKTLTYQDAFYHGMAPIVYLQHIISHHLRADVAALDSRLRQRYSKSSLSQGQPQVASSLFAALARRAHTSANRRFSISRMRSSAFSTSVSYSFSSGVM